MPIAPPFPTRPTVLQRHEASVDSDKEYEMLKEEANKVASRIGDYRSNAPFLYVPDEQDCLKKIFDSLAEFGDKFGEIFPIYRPVCQDFRLGEAGKMERGELEFTPLRNFHTYLIHILRSLKEFYFGAKVITAFFQLPRNRFIQEFRRVQNSL
jgi:hypothetical protein